VSLASATGPSESSGTLLARPYPGGSATVVLGGDNAQWTTNNHALGLGSFEAIAAAEAVVRQAPGGVDSINFGFEHSNLSTETLLARPSPGGDDKVHLGGDKAEWDTSGSTLGAGSVEAIAQAEPRSRPPPGGADSVDAINEAPVAAPLSAQELMARPATGGKASIVLGGDTSNWTTSQGETHVQKEIAGSEVEYQAPGGTASVDFGAITNCKLTVEELLARPAPGGEKTFTFGQMPVHSPIASDLRLRPSPGGSANVVLGSDDGQWDTSSQTHNGEVGLTALPYVRPPPGGVDSVNMAAPKDMTSVETLLARPAPGGRTTVVLGGDDSSWKSCSNAVGVGCTDAASAAHIASGAMDSIDFTGGGSTPAKPMRIMSATPGTAGSLVLNDIAASPEVGVSSNRFASGSNQNAGNCITNKSTTRLHQAPGGTSSIDLSDGSCPVSKATTSSNRFANGTNQNQGNWITDRSSTRLQQAPGGASSIDLSDNSFCHAVGVSASPFPAGSPLGSPPTNRSSTKVRHAPGGASTLCLGEMSEQNENVNNANIQQSQPIMKKHPLHDLTAGEDTTNVVLG